jgi:hypothetical protein
MTFLKKTSETKSLLRFFARHFLFQKNILLQPSMTYFHFYKKGFLNSKAVRIRVKRRSSDLDHVKLINLTGLLISNIYSIHALAPINVNFKRFDVKYEQ